MAETESINEETMRAMEDAELGRNLEEWDSVDAFLEDLCES